MENKDKKVELNLTDEELLLLHTLVYTELKYYHSINDDIKNDCEGQMLLNIRKKLNHYLFSNIEV